MALNEQDELREAVTTIFEDNVMLKLYDDSQSYLWKNRVQLFNALEVLKTKDLNRESKFLSDYKAWKATREASLNNRDDIAQIL